MSEEKVSEKQWYAVTTFIGHEQKAAENIRTRIEGENLISSRSEKYFKNR